MVLAGARATEGWVRVLVALDAIVGAMLLVAGIYLLDPGLADLGLYVEAPRYLLLGGVFVAAGLLLAQAAIFGLARRATTPFDGFLVKPALWCVGALLSLLALRALVSGDSSSAWLGALAVPGALAFATLRAMRLIETGVEAPVPALGPETGRRRRNGFGELARGAVVALLGMYGLTTIVIASMFAYVLLDISFIGGRSINVAAAIATLSALHIRASLILVPLGAALALLGVLLLIAWRRFRSDEIADFDRPLSAVETSFVASCVKETEAYIALHRLRALAARARDAFAGWLVLFGVGALVTALLIRTIVASIYAPAGEGWQLYLTEGPGAVAAVLVSLLSLIFLPGGLARLLSVRAAEAGGLRMLGAYDGEAAVQTVFVGLVRRRLLKPGDAFDPGLLLARAGRWTAGWAVGWNAVVAIALVLWWPHDRARDTLYTEQWIETGDFWTLERQRFAYDAVASVRLECSGNVSYRIVLPNGARRELLSQYGFGSQLQDAAKVDERLRSAGVRFGLVLPGEAPSDAAGVVDRECLEDLMAGMDPKERALAERVLHLDAWFERRWRKRTGELSVSRQ